MFKFIKAHFGAFWPGSLAGGSTVFIYLLHLPPLPNAQLIGIAVKISSVAVGSLIGGMCTLAGNDIYKHYKNKYIKKKSDGRYQQKNKKRA